MFDLFRKAKSNSREILHLEDKVFEVQRRKGRRGLRMVIEVDGRMRVLANQSVSSSQIQHFLKAHAPWIHRVAKKYAAEREKFPLRQYASGETFPYMGRPLILQFSPTFRKTWRVSVEGSDLRVWVPLAQWSRDFANTPHPEAAAVISKFYRQQAREILAERVRVWSQRTGLIVTALSFRGQKTRWGSLSGKARMSLNWKLIAAPLEIIDYVVIHELCHIQHHNHSADFWQLVETFDPKFSEHKTWLRKNQLSFAFLK